MNIRSDIAVNIITVMDNADVELNKQFAAIIAGRESLDKHIQDVPELLRRAHDRLEHNIKIITKNRPNNSAELLAKMKDAKTQLGIYEQQYQTVLISEMMAICQATNARVNAIDERMQAVAARVNSLEAKMELVAANVTELKDKPAAPAPVVAVEKKQRTNLFGLKK